MNQGTIGPRLSVVVACVDARSTIDECLSSFRVALEPVAAELLVVHSGDTVLEARVRDAHRWARVVAASSPALVPDLWAQGFRVSRGEVVAFSTGHSIVGREWAQSLLEAIGSGATGAGGALVLAPGAGMLATAVYLLRYSSFMPPPPAGPVHEIPGDNAAYLRAALERHAASFSEGFWEVDFHRRIRREGAILVFAPAATCAIRPAFRWASVMRHRYAHGRYSGRWRVSIGSVPSWRPLLFAPLVPLVLALRVLRRAAGVPRLLARAAAALPAVVAVAAAWAAGEAAGAWQARMRRVENPA
jgi:hypothetical protein